MSISISPDGAAIENYQKREKVCPQVYHPFRKISHIINAKIRSAIHYQVDMTGTHDRSPDIPDLFAIHYQVDLKRLIVYPTTHYQVHMTGVTFQVHLSCPPDSVWRALLTR